MMPCNLRTVSKLCITQYREDGGGRGQNQSEYLSKTIDVSTLTLHSFFFFCMTLTIQQNIFVSMKIKSWLNLKFKTVSK